MFRLLASLHARGGILVSAIELICIMLYVSIKLQHFADSLHANVIKSALC